MTVVIALGVAVVCFGVAYLVVRPFGWWLFKLAHRNNPEALAFAEREWPSRSVERNQSGVSVERNTQP